MLTLARGVNGFVLEELVIENAQRYVMSGLKHMESSGDTDLRCHGAARMSCRAACRWD